MPSIVRALPVLFVRDVEAAAVFYRDTLGFSIDFVHGTPPFYGAVSRDGATLHLKFVHGPVLTPGPDEDGLISAFLAVEDAQALYDEYVAAGATFNQALTTQPWGWRDIVVVDVDGNGVCFAERVPSAES
jgi:uncharacterized glyoxalase superfamily protein PhnB